MLISIFSWNTQSSTVPQTDKDIFSRMQSEIGRDDPDLVVVGFQEDRYPGSYFHSHVLTREMPSLGYSLVHRTKLMGVGVTSYKGLLRGDIFQRGLRMSVYCRTSSIGRVRLEGEKTYACSHTRGKGAIVSFLHIRKIGGVALVLCHLPFDASSLVRQRQPENAESMIRRNAISLQNIHFNNIYDVARSFDPDHTFVFGDLNYRVDGRMGAGKISERLSEDLRSVYLERDELLNEMRRENVYRMFEGVDDLGPSFPPTCKLDSERKWKTGKHDQRAPSWTDRILYSEGARCLLYLSFDCENMRTSDHVGVYSLFDL